MLALRRAACQAALPAARRPSVPRALLRTCTHPRSSDAHRIESQHVDTPHNHEGTPFEFTPENLLEAKNIMKRYPSQYQKAAVIPLLNLAQRQNDGWLPLAAMNKVAKICGIPPIQVYETASFYTMFNRKPIGKHHVQVCTTTPCQLRGADSVLSACEKRLGVHAGETTADGMFTLGEVECAGACANAPVMSVGDDYYEDLTAETAVRILDAVARGEHPKPGPQNNRRNCEGPQGKTTLLGAEIKVTHWRPELDE